MILSTNDRQRLYSQQFVSEEETLCDRTTSHVWPSVPLSYLYLYRSALKREWDSKAIQYLYDYLVKYRLVHVLYVVAVVRTFLCRYKLYVGHVFLPCETNITMYCSTDA